MSTDVLESPVSRARQPKSKPVPAKEFDPIAVSELLKHASDPTRLSVLASLSESEKSVTELCLLVNNTQPATSHHLALLRAAKLIERRREGKFNYYSLSRIGQMLIDICFKLEV